MTSTGAVQADLPLTTAQELPGTQVAETSALRFGLIVRSMGVAKGFTATFSAMRSVRSASTRRYSRTRAATRSTG